MRFHSHSTMYLLKPLVICAIFPLKLIFTFHHVSIKTATSSDAWYTMFVFTFHHVSIKTKHSLGVSFLILIFTFHHVSIKTPCDSSFYKICRSFTFHHVSIKTYDGLPVWDDDLHSHSTMYLLKPAPYTSAPTFVVHSHSTMYLLKRCYCTGSIFFVPSFTFHHVSIKTIYLPT